MKVCKFSGSAIGSVESMKKVAGLIADGTPRIVVLSATAGVTEQLERITAHLFNREQELAHDEITRLEFKFIDFVNELIKDESIKKEAVNYTLGRFQSLWDFTKQTFVSADEKEVLAQGELISSAIMSFYLKEQKVDNALLSAFDFMRMGVDDEPDMAFITENLHKAMQLYPDAKLFITQGAICKNAYGETIYLKQGGSDYSATLMGAALQAEEIEIWTDFNRMQNGDPCVVKGTQPVKQLSYEEAGHLAYFGTQLLQPQCIAPARLMNIPIRLMNPTEPASTGTLISNDCNSEVIKTVTTKDAIMFLKFESNNTLRPYLFISKIFEIFAKYRTPLCLLASSNIGVSVATDNKNFLSNIIRELKRYADILVEDRMTIVSVVGNMKWQYAGFEARIMGALKEVPLRMISYGSNSNDISLVIKAADKQKALQSLNDTLFARSR